jgi:HlyD family secretion protein
VVDSTISGSLAPPARVLGSTPPDAEQQRKRRQRQRIRQLRQVLAALVLAASAVLGVWALRPEAVPVDVAPVERGALSVAVVESGRTRVKDRYVVSAATAGQLSRLWLEPGDEVRQGDTLAEVSPAPSPLIDPRSRAEAEARLGAARSHEGQARVRLARAATGRDRARRDFERAKQLAAGGALSAEELERADFTVRLEQAEVESAEFAVKVAGEEVRLAIAALGHPGGGPRHHIDVLAPVSGRVLRVLQKSEGIVGAGTALLEIGDPTALEIVVDLLTTDAVHVRPGTLAAIEGWGGETALEARVIRVEPSGFTRLSALGVEEQRVNVILAFSDPRAASSILSDGYHVEARIVLWAGVDVVKAPALAVFRQGAGSACFKVEDGVARLVPIGVGHRGELDVEVLSGLSPGDHVVLHPGDRVKDGARVDAHR